MAAKKNAFQEVQQVPATHVIVSRAIVVFIILIAYCNTVHARCPVNGLSVNIKTDKDYGRKNVYVQIQDRTGIRKIELITNNETNFTGVIPFSTRGFTFLVELSCNYFPKDLTVFADGDVIKIIKLNKKSLNSYKDKSNSAFEYIYEVNIFIEKLE